MRILPALPIQGRLLFSVRVCAIEVYGHIYNQDMNMMCPHVQWHRPMRMPEAWFHNWVHDDMIQVRFSFS